ncbi:hypothetical protein K402DRAFT_453960 [Aulographum hederae CBS 113979]|uniref:Uncharacterized protein n=1 Tax=Aulographum hederae CBS 113979 TaxID=1176131 RepID=A0A6G1H1L3_9PEZI|nr:hypothetical protein K402DRAFT_453960 [Aulographum hederae CBS 113979]
MSSSAEADSVIPSHGATSGPASDSASGTSSSSSSSEVPLITTSLNADDYPPTTTILPGVSENIIYSTRDSSDHDVAAGVYIAPRRCMIPLICPDNGHGGGKGILILGLFKKGIKAIFPKFSITIPPIGPPGISPPDGSGDGSEGGEGEGEQQSDGPSKSDSASRASSSPASSCSASTAVSVSELCSTPSGKSTVECTSVARTMTGYSVTSFATTSTAPSCPYPVPLAPSNIRNSTDLPNNSEFLSYALSELCPLYGLGGLSVTGSGATSQIIPASLCVGVSTSYRSVEPDFISEDHIGSLSRVIANQQQFFESNFVASEKHIGVFSRVIAKQYRFVQSNFISPERHIDFLRRVIFIVISARNVCINIRMLRLVYFRLRLGVEPPNSMPIHNHRPAHDASKLYNVANYIILFLLAPLLRRLQFPQCPRPQRLDSDIEGNIIFDNHDAVGNFGYTAPWGGTVEIPTSLTCCPYGLSVTFLATAGASNWKDNVVAFIAGDSVWHSDRADPGLPSSEVRYWGSSQPEGSLVDVWSLACQQKVKIEGYSTSRKL